MRKPQRKGAKRASKTPAKAVEVPRITGGDTAVTGQPSDGGEFRATVETPHPDTGGRPTLYRPEYDEQARKLCLVMGATDKDLAAYFEVTEQTINNWKLAHPSFFVSVKAGKAGPDDEVERALFERATGYSHPAVKILSTPLGVQEVAYIERYPPDATSMIFWLKNRRPAQWRDKQIVDVEKGGTLAELLAAAFTKAPT